VCQNGIWLARDFKHHSIHHPNLSLWTIFALPDAWVNEVEFPAPGVMTERDSGRPVLRLMLRTLTINCDRADRQALPVGLRRSDEAHRFVTVQGSDIPPEVIT
jgi:hypothetical protein